jgi:hypothetical protein
MFLVYGEMRSLRIATYVLRTNGIGIRKLTTLEALSQITTVKWRNELTTVFVQDTE